MRKVLSRRSRRLVILVVALFALAGGIAYATSADSGVIHGCYKTQNGQLRVVPAGESCLSSEQAIRWNQGGPGTPARWARSATKGLTATKARSATRDQRAIRVP